MALKNLIKNEKDPEKLREIALLTLESLNKTQEDLQKIYIELEKASHGQLMLINIRDQKVILQKKVFGRSSEKKKHSKNAKIKYDFVLENEEDSAHKRKPKPELEKEEVIHELSSEEQVCPKCDSSMTEMKDQYEESEEITIVQRTFKKIIHRRKKYRCKCNSCIVTAIMPTKLIEGGKYSTDFGIEVAVGKYADHLPLERQVKIMKREDLYVTSQTLWAQIQAVSHYLIPVWHKLHKDILSSEVLHIDETRWEMLNKNPKRWQLWGLCNNKSVYYNAVDTRSGEQAYELLNGYTGVAVSDAYSAYKSASQKEGVKWISAGCWAHARRKFVEIESNYPTECETILDFIGDLFKIENKAESYDHLAILRDKESKDITDKIKKWITITKALPESGLSKAINYIKNNWNELTVFLVNKKVPLTNNAVERALRGPVVGRKNHYGSKSERGAKAASILYSVMESCKVNNVNASKYLQHVIPLRLNKQVAPTPYEYSKNEHEKTI